MNFDFEYNPRYQTGKTLPQPRTVKDFTLFIQETPRSKKNFLMFKGAWFQLNITPEDDLRVNKLGVGLIDSQPITYDFTLKDRGRFSHPSYTQGNYKFDGKGYLFDFDYTVTGKSYGVIDNLLVRNNLTVYDFLVIQKRFTNGSLFIGNGAKVASVNGATITFEDPSALGVCPFAANDLLVVKRVAPDNTTILRSVEATCSSVSGNSIVVSYNSGTFQKGDDVVRVGNTTNTDRQGLIYLTADDTDSPFMDILSGVASWADWHNTSKVKARYGNLANFVSTQFGTLSGYGSWITDNFYLENGFIVLSSTGYIRAGLASYTDTTNTGFYLGNYSGSKVFKIYNSATKYFDYNGTDIALVGGAISSGVIKSETTKNYGDGVAGYWLGKYGTSDYRFEIYNSASKYFRYDNTNLYLMGATITAGLIRTKSSGQRIELGEGFFNEIRFYDSTSLKDSLVSSSLSGSNFLIYGRDGVSIQTGTDGDVSIYSDGIGAINLIPSSSTGVDIIGKLRKVNNLQASSYTNYVVKSDGTSYTPGLVAFGELTSKPTTLAGYGITDACGFRGVLSSFPSSPVPGQFYYDTSLNKLRFYKDAIDGWGSIDAIF